MSAQLPSPPSSRGCSKPPSVSMTGTAIGSDTDADDERSTGRQRFVGTYRLLKINFNVVFSYSRFYPDLLLRHAANSIALQPTQISATSFPRKLPPRSHRSSKQIIISTLLRVKILPTSLSTLLCVLGVQSLPRSLKILLGGWATGEDHKSIL